MQADIRIAPLAAHPEVLPVLAAWFQVEWPAWYGPGGPGDAEQDLRDFANRGSLPVGVVAFREGRLCGVAALKAQSIASHAQLSPWAAAGLVEPTLRQRGIGAALLAALEAEARALGYPSIYCATSTAASLLERAGWSLLETVQHDGQALGLYRKALA
jgi:GNAT superfamily N-acetyltransferase